MNEDTAEADYPLTSRAWFAAIVPALLGVTGCALSVLAFGEYGWALFLLSPFLVGMLSAYLYNRRFHRPFGTTLGVAFGGMLALGSLIIFGGLDGLICVLMAAPLGFLLCLPGVALGRLIARIKREKGIATMILALGSFPLLGAWESAIERTLPTHQTVTTVTINASPETVWEEVIAFSKIDKPPGLLFKFGLAYPVEATIEGEGVGAIRHCVFSTGAFVEPITVWDRPNRLAFDVIEQPEPMHEISPYPGLHPPHLDHYFVSERGQFLLTPLPDGGTLLEGTTWYHQDIWPHWYWEPIASKIIQAIHSRVLEHIKEQVEAE